MRKDTRKQQEFDQIGRIVEQQFHIKIAGDGKWFYEGGEIHRKALVKLFSTVLNGTLKEYFGLKLRSKKGVLRLKMPHLS